MPTECALCGSTALPVSGALGVCRECIIAHPTEARDVYMPRRAALRRKIGLPPSPPRSSEGLLCDRCHNNCRIPPGEVGFCGVRRNNNGAITGGGPEGATVHWYRDPLPTNCVADGVCGEKDATAGHNLAVFYYGCSFDCLYCQNWQHKQWPRGQRRASAAELAGAVRPETACVCYFGGDPTPHLPHSLEAARPCLGAARLRRGDARLARGRKAVRICWETNGSMKRSLLERMAELALETGGTIKVDFKASDPLLHRAMCGVPNAQVLKTIEFLAGLRRKRPQPPLLVVSTLLVPGYVTPEEVRVMGTFLAALGPDIPYRLLCFAPQHAMSDLPTTSLDHARSALAAAEEAGLLHICLGNTHLLTGWEQRSVT